MRNYSLSKIQIENESQLIYYDLIDNGCCQRYKLKTNHNAMRGCPAMRGAVKDTN